MAHASASTQLRDIRDINEQLLLAGLREQGLAAQLGRQLAFTSAITNSLGEGVAALDTHGQLTFVNPAATELLGWSEAELLGRELHSLVHVDCPSDCPLAQANRSGVASRNDDDVFTCRDGTLLPVAYSTAPLATDGVLTGAVVAFRDVTERKRLLHHEQIARANAEAAVRLRSETLQMIAHDLRTPLTAVKVTAQFLARAVRGTRTVDAEQMLAALGRIDVATVRMVAVLSELLDVARLQEGQLLTLQQRPVDLVALTRRISDEQQAITKHVVAIDSTEATLVGDWDDVRLERVLENLLGNAIKYSATDSPIRIRLWRDDASDLGRWAVLELRDEGVGIPAADFPRIFERFHRGQNVTGRFAGTGLGLAGSKAIIEQHNGSIDIQSTEGAGTTVTVRLPLP
jgi:PAS domain S-box-containing protein